LPFDITHCDLCVDSFGLFGYNTVISSPVEGLLDFYHHHGGKGGLYIPDFPIYDIQ
jgi:hypothetical protein